LVAWSLLVARSASHNFHLFRTIIYRQFIMKKRLVYRKCFWNQLKIQISQWQMTIFLCTEIFLLSIYTVLNGYVCAFLSFSHTSGGFAFLVLLFSNFQKVGLVKNYIETLGWQYDIMNSRGAIIKPNPYYLKACGWLGN
jgi:hypothetical protein